MSEQYQVPATPRIISPSPTPSESGDSYFGPRTRSVTRRTAASSGVISEERDSDSDLEKRARALSRKPKSRRPSGVGPTKAKIGSSSNVKKSEPLTLHGTALVNGHLSPASASTSYWHDFSRSPSPLGLIPIHRHWRSFVHRHEIPRKVLHVSIGFFTLHLYTRGVQTATIHPWLLGALAPIASVEFLRHRSPAFNRLYVRVLGALMRESEVNDKYNGVIFYLLGAWAALRFFPKDVAVMGVLLLSWCDTTASTIGRLYGRFTPRIRRGKSLAGSSAAAIVGIATAVTFWGIIVPRYWGLEDTFMFRGVLGLPEPVKLLLGQTGQGKGVLGGWAAIGILSLWTGLVASLSEVVDLFGLDDNLTIPVLSGIGIWGFLKVFG